MRPTDPVNVPPPIEEMLQSKVLEPLLPGAVAELEKIVALDVTGFTEEEVRSFVIDPIVRVLGYGKGVAFSVDLERSMTFLGKRKRRPDYRFKLWEENFWLIEAKKPRPTKGAFGYDDLAQALEYACHPDINAALVVLCDGIKVEIFDREVSITEPILRLPLQDLVARFDEVRALLSPWQMWFFQKRRVARLIDKVFSREFNLTRVDEFKKLVNGRLNSLREVVLNNFRAIEKDQDADGRAIDAAELDEAVDVHMFFDHSMPLTTRLLRRLVALSMPRSFDVLYKMFPDHPRDASDTFYVHATAYLMMLSGERDTVEWLPAWLSPGKQNQAPVDHAARTMIRHCLTLFAGDDSRRTILLAGAALRRVQKLLFLGTEQQWRQAEIRHAIHRYMGPEQQWGQFVASPEGQAVGMLRTAGIMAAARFVSECQKPDGGFNTEIAKVRLKELWAIERWLLQSIPNYARLHEERGISDLGMTESTFVTFDGLGHGMLCMLPPFPAWRSYIVEHLRSEVEVLASMGSWSAREVLGIDFETTASATDELFAERFFLGDLDLFRALREAYTARP